MNTRCRATDRQRKNNWGNLPWAHLARGPRWGALLPYQKRSKSSNRTVTLIQQSGKYSVDNFTEINH